MLRTLFRWWYVFVPSTPSAFSQDAGRGFLFIHCSSGSTKRMEHGALSNLPGRLIDCETARSRGSPRTDPRNDGGVCLRHGSGYGILQRLWPVAVGVDAARKSSWSSLTTFTIWPVVVRVDTAREVPSVDGARRRLGGARWSSCVVQFDCGELGRIRLN